MTIGIIANPAAGKDIRRLVAHASPVSDGTKIGVVRRVVLAASDAGADRILLSRDRQALTERAIEGLETDADIELIDAPSFGDHTDTTTAAKHLLKEQADVVVVLGGDGTNRDVAMGWLDVPVIPISTGTNNVFPLAIEGTVAGVAAAAISRGTVGLEEGADRMNTIHVRIRRTDVPVDEIALVDVALVAARFVGSRAVWDPDVLRELVACIAEPATVGLSAIAGVLRPSGRREPGGVHVRFGGDRSVRAPIAPGRIARIPVGEVRQVLAGTVVELPGPGVLALDGEREVVMADGDVAHCTIEQDGPWVIDVERAVGLAAARGFFDGG